MGPHKIRAVVFDLDGTLANTAGLAAGRRVPWDVLKLCPPGAPVDPISFGPEVCDLPGRLLAAGYRVGILTRSPAAYASTVIGLLGLDQELLLPSGAYAGALDEITRQLDVTSTEVLYIGDREADAEIARAAGSAFVSCPWVDGYSDAAFGELPMFEKSPTPSRGRGDEVINRVRSGEASDDDYAELEDREMYSVLREYGDPARARSPRTRAAMVSRLAPWVFGRPPDWAALLSTGDVGRLLDIHPVAMKQYLPSERLNQVLRDVSADFPETVDGIVAALPADVQDQVQRPAPLVGGTAWQLIPAAHESADVALALEEPYQSYLRLLSWPGRADRRELQMRLLAPEGAPAFRNCLIVDRYGFPRHAITRAELREDHDLSEKYASWLRAAFPLVVLPSGCSALLPFRFQGSTTATWWGEQLKEAKDWKGGAGGHAGPECRAGYLALIAEVLGAHLAEVPSSVSVTYVAPSEPTSERPLAASARIAYMAADVSRHTCRPLLAKRPDGELSVRRGHGQVLLIEDQVTSGGTAARSREALIAAGWDVVAVWAWSSSRWPPGYAETCGWWTGAEGLAMGFSGCPAHGTTPLG